MKNGALQDYPLDEDDLENFYIRNLSRFVVVALGSQGLPGAPRVSQGAPRGSQGAPKGSSGWGGGSQGLQGAVIIGNYSFYFYFKLTFLKYKLKQFPVKVGGF